MKLIKCSSLILLFLIIFGSIFFIKLDNVSNEELFFLLRKIREADRAISRLITFEFMTKQPHLAGKEKYLLLGNDGKKWLYRNYMTIAELKKMSPFPGLSLYTVYHFSNICGIKTPVTYKIKLPVNGILTVGAVQEFIEDSVPLKEIKKFNNDHIQYLLKNQILDFLTLETNRNMEDFFYNEHTDSLVAIDKELAFLNPGRANVQRRRNYVIDDTYQKIWQAYSRREIEIVLETLFTFIDYLQSIDDQLYLEIFKKNMFKFNSVCLIHFIIFIFRNQI